MRRMRDAQALGLITAVILVGCSTTPAGYIPPGELEASFTTEGKPTRTEVTPDGRTYALYDAAQDPDVQVAFAFLKAVNEAFPGGEWGGPFTIARGKSIQKHNQYYADYLHYGAFLEDRKQTQFNDMLRIGCVRPEWDGYNGSDAGAPFYVANTIAKSCQNPSYGSSELDSCEIENLAQHGDQIRNAEVGGLYAHNAWFKIGNPHLTYRREAEGGEIGQYFKTGCQSYEGENNG